MLSTRTAHTLGVSESALSSRASSAASLPLHGLRTASVATTSGLTIRSAGIEPDSLGIAGCTTHLACWPEPRLAGDCWGNWTNGCYRGLPLC